YAAFSLSRQFLEDEGVSFDPEGNIHSLVWEAFRNSEEQTYRVVYRRARQHCLYFRPLPQGQGSLRPADLRLRWRSSRASRSMISAGARRALSRAVIVRMWGSMWRKNRL